jgi:ParB/Sulfiredoxin domain
MTGPTPKNWPAEQVSMRRVDELTPYAKNARLHSDDQIGLLAKLIEKYGFTMPVLVDEGGVLIAGHARSMAAKKLGIEEIPTMVAVGWSDEKKRAYVIADNRLSELATWDEPLLSSELGEISLADDFDFELTGFSLDDLGELEIPVIADDNEDAEYLAGEDVEETPDEDCESEPDYNAEKILGIHVRCDNAADQMALACELQKRGYVCQSMSVAV